MGEKGGRRETPFASTREDGRWTAVQIPFFSNSWSSSCIAPRPGQLDTTSGGRARPKSRERELLSRLFSFQPKALLPAPHHRITPATGRPPIYSQPWAQVTAEELLPPTPSTRPLPPPRVQIAGSCSLSPQRPISVSLAGPPLFYLLPSSLAARPRLADPRANRRTSSRARARRPSLPPSSTCGPPISAVMPGANARSRCTSSRRRRTLTCTSMAGSGCRCRRLLPS